MVFQPANKEHEKRKRRGPRPKIVRERYQQIVFEVCDLEKWRGIVEDRVRRAERGSDKAFEQLAKILLPPEEQKSDIKQTITVRIKGVDIDKKFGPGPTV